jgi:hypothetical protein
MNLFIHLVNKHVLSEHYVTGILMDFSLQKNN